MLERFSKSYRLNDKEKFVKKLINFSIDQLKKEFLEVTATK